MSDIHATIPEQDARHASFAAEPVCAANPLVLRRGLKGSWSRAVRKMASQRMARTMDLVVLLVLGMAASEARAQPPLGGPPPMPGPPPMARPPMGGMMSPPRFALPMGPGVGGRPGPGPIPIGAGGAPGFPAIRPHVISGPAGLASGRPTLVQPVPGGAGGPANVSRVGPSGRPEPGRAFNPRHADWYYGDWSDSRGGAWDKARDYVREERTRDYAAGLAWGVGGWGSSGYGSGYSYDSGSGSGYGSGYNSGYGTDSSDPYATAGASSTVSDSSRTDAAPETKSGRQQDGAAAEQGDQKFDRARDAFKAGDYVAALDLTDAALRDLPGDRLVHEFKALALFARGEDARAAAEIHGVLAARPGMDWTTMFGLYPDVETYNGQLRSLEDRSGRDPKAAAPRFVLAYHYLVTGHKDAALSQLKGVLASEPGDRVARRLLDFLTGPAPAPAETTPPVPEGDGAAGRTPPAELVGRWRGERDGSTFDLSLDGQGRFLWQAARQGQTTARVSGAYEYSANTLTLKAEDRSPLRVSVTALSPDSLRFITAADIPGDPGLVVRRAAIPAAPDRD